MALDLSSKAVIELAAQLEVQGLAKGTKSLQVALDLFTKAGVTAPKSFKVISLSIDEMVNKVAYLSLALKQNLSLWDKFRGKQAPTAQLLGSVATPGAQYATGAQKGRFMPTGVVAAGLTSGTAPGASAKAFAEETKAVKVNTEVKKENEKTNKVLSNSITGMISKSLKIVPIWMAIRAVYQSVFTLIQTSLKFLVEWEKVMAEIAIVGGGTNVELKTLSTNLLALGSAMGTSITDLGEGAKLWAQQGRTYAEIIPLMKTTAQLSLITGRSISDSVEDLTSIMKSYGIEARKTGQIVDAVTAIELKHAITTNVLVEAMKEVAPTAKQFGIAMEDMMGIITATHVATRETGSRIGHAWKTVIQRMATSSADLIQSVAGVKVYMDEAGKATFDNTGYYRNFSDIIDELAISWNSLTQTQQAALTESLGGKRRINEIISTFQQYDEKIAATTNALLSVGAANRAVSILLETADMKTKQLNNSWKQLTNTFIEGPFWKGIIDGLNGVIQALIRLNETQSEANQRETMAAQEAIATGYRERIQVTEAYIKLLEKQNFLLAKRAELESQLASNPTDSGITRQIEAVDKALLGIQNNLQNKIFAEKGIAGKNLQEALFSLDVDKVDDFQTQLKNEIDDTFNKAVKHVETLTSTTKVKWGTLVGQVLSPIGPRKQVTETENAVKTLLKDLNSTLEQEMRSRPLEFLIQLKARVTDKDIQETLDAYIQQFIKQSKNREEKIRLDFQTQVGLATNEKTTEQIEKETAREVKREEMRIDALREYGFLESEILQMKLDFYNTHKDLAKDITEEDRKDLELQIQIAKKKEALNNFLKDDIVNERKLEALGYNRIQIASREVAKYEYLAKLRLASEEEVIEKRRELIRLVQEEMNAYSTQLKESLSSGLSGLLKGESTLSEFGDSIASSFKDSVLDQFSSGVMDKLFQFTGLGEAFGRQIFDIRHLFEKEPKNIAEAISQAHSTVYDYIYKGHVDGLNAAKTGIATGDTATGGLGGLLGSLFGGGGGAGGGLGGILSSLFGGGGGGGGLSSLFGGLFGGNKQQFPTIPYGPYGKGVATVPIGGQVGYGYNVGGTNAAGQAMQYGASQQGGLSGLLGGLFGGGAGGGMGGLGAIALSALGGFSAFRSASKAPGGIQKTAGFLGAAAPFATMIPGIGPFLGGAMTVASMIMGLFKKKQTQVSEETTTELKQISTKIQVTNKELQIANRNLVALRNEKTFILPESAYFSSKSNLEDEFAVHTIRGLAP